MNCRHCGATLDKVVRFCPKCGNPMAASPSSHPLEDHAARTDEPNQSTDAPDVPLQPDPTPAEEVSSDAPSPDHASEPSETSATHPTIPPETSTTPSQNHPDVPSEELAQNQSSVPSEQPAPDLPDMPSEASAATPDLPSMPSEDLVAAPDWPHTFSTPSTTAPVASMPSEAPVAVPQQHSGLRGNTAAQPAIPHRPSPGNMTPQTSGQHPVAFPPMMVAPQPVSSVSPAQTSFAAHIQAVSQTDITQTWEWEEEIDPPIRPLRDIQQTPPAGLALSPFPPPAPLLYYRLNKSKKEKTQMMPAVVRRRQRRGCGGCLYGCLVALVIVLIAVGAGWIFYLRPLLHDTAQSRLDTAMSSAIKQIPSVPTQMSIGSLPVTETEINNLISGNLAPSDPMSHVQTTINTNGVRVDFQFYGFPCAVTAVPKVVNGQLVATPVNVEGIALLVMTPEEMASLLNKHLVEAQRQINHPIKSVQLKDHEMDLLLS